MYRRLSDAELLVLVEEQQAHETWRDHIAAYARFAHDVYGPEAAVITLGLGSVYNDEYDEPIVGGALVYDAKGRLLAPDQTTDWWRAPRDGTFPGLRDSSGQLVQFSDYTLDEYVQALPVPVGPLLTFCLDRPPRRRLYPVYLPIAGQPDTDTVQAGDSRRVLSELRPMVEDELHQLVNEYGDWEWHRWLQFARDLYGPRATTIRLARDRPYRFADGVALAVGATVYGSEGEPLEPDLGSQWWRGQEHEQATWERHSGESPDPSWRETVVQGYVLQLCPGWTKEDKVFVLRTDRPPARSFDVVYVLYEEPTPAPAGELDERSFLPLELTQTSYWMDPPGRHDLPGPAIYGLDFDNIPF